MSDSVDADQLALEDLEARMLIISLCLFLVKVVAAVNHQRDQRRIPPLSAPRSGRGVSGRPFPSAGNRFKRQFNEILQHDPREEMAEGIGCLGKKCPR